MLRKLLLFVVFPLAAVPQNNQPDYDYEKWIHFGLTIGYNISDYVVRPSSAFFNQDSIASVLSYGNPEILTMGIISDLHLGEHTNLRLTPSIAYSRRNLSYFLSSKQYLTQVIRIANVELPLLLKFKTKRYENTRLYAIAGVKYSLDLASKDPVRNTPELIQLFRDDFSLEYGIGFDLYLPMMKLSPEIKISRGLVNQLVPDQENIYASVIDRMFSRTFLFSLHFE